MWLADGQQVRLRLDAVYDRSQGFGDLVLPASLVAAHDAHGLVSTLGLRYEQGTTARLEAAVPGLRLVPAGSPAEAGDASDQQGAWGELLVAISLGFTAIAVVNTFAIATAARRREYADLRLAGATSPQLHRLASCRWR